MALRYEHLDDDGLFGGIEQTLQEVTLTSEYKFSDEFLVRGEFRRDFSNTPFFPSRDAAARAPEHGARRPGVVDRQQDRQLVKAMAFIGLRVHRRHGPVLRGRRRPTWPAAIACGRPVMTFDHIVGLVVTLGLLVYLTYALLKPEKF